MPSDIKITVIHLGIWTICW